MYISLTNLKFLLVFVTVRSMFFNYGKVMVDMLWVHIIEGSVEDVERYCQLAQSVPASCIDVSFGEMTKTVDRQCYLTTTCTSPFVSVDVLLVPLFVDTLTFTSKLSRLF